MLWLHRVSCFQGEFFNKTQLIRDLIDFKLTADSINAEEHYVSEDYIRGVDAVIEKLKLRKGELTIN